MSAPVSYVPDGDPCPKHGLPTRLLWLCQGAGLVSRCAACDEDFLAWFAANSRTILPPDSTPPPPTKAGQFRLL